MKTLKQGIRIFIGSILTVGLIGCDFAPKLKVPRPELPVKKEFYPASQGSFKLSWGWWKNFKNPELNKLIDLALKHNEDLKIAAIKVEEALALSELNKAQLYPLLGYKGQVSRSELPKNTEKSIEELAQALKVPFTLESPRTSYNLIFSVSYELDFWGKLKNQRRSSLAKVLSLKAAQDTVKISLISGIITLYFNGVALKKEIELAKKIEQDLKRVWEIEKRKLKCGLANEAEVYKAEAQYEEAKKLVQELSETLERVKADLAFLVGMSPKELFNAQIQFKGDLPKNLKIPSFLPSEVLLKRPDIQMAEAQLKAANFDVGVAKALYFPDITLTGTLGSLSSKLKDLIESPSYFWSLGSGFTGPILDFGRTKARVKYAEAKKKEALINYIKTVKQAFKEVYQGLTSVEYGKKILNLQEKRIKSLQKNLEIAKKMVDTGLSDDLTMLSVEVEVLREKMKLIEAKNNLVKSYIYLYKALGSGLKVPPS